MLSNSIKEAGNVVLASKLLLSDSLFEVGLADSMRRSDPIFSDYAFKEGFANLDTDAAFQEDVKTCRAFTPTFNYQN